MFLTDFADQAVMLPVAVATALALAAFGWWRGLGAWLFAVVGTLGTMAFLKYVCFMCAIPLSDTGLRNPSGHAASAAVIYGGIVVLLLRGRVPRPALIAAPVAIAVFFSITRIAVHAHDPVEVLVGSAVGLTGAIILAVMAGQRPPFRTWPVVVVMLVVALSFHGQHFKPEKAIHAFPLFAWIPLPNSCRI